MPKDDERFFDAQIPYFLLKPVESACLLEIISQIFDAAYEVCAEEE